MNIKANKEKKELVIKMIKEIAEFTRNLEKSKDIQPDISTSKIILQGFLKTAFDFEPLIRFVDDRLHKAKGAKSIAFWASLVKIIKKYFEEANQLK